MASPVPIYTIGKSFTFDAAHQLLHHDGKCRFLHGHTYRVCVEVSGPLEQEGPKQGMVVDFGDVKDVWKREVEPLCDHKFLNDTLPLENTTAEEIAGWMLGVFRGHLGVGVVAITVWETADSWARAERK